MKKIALIGFGLTGALALSGCTDLQPIDGTTPLTTSGVTTTGTTTTTTVTPTTTVTQTGGVPQFNGQQVFSANGGMTQQVTIQQPGQAPVNTQVFATGFGGQPIEGQVYVTADGRIIVYDPQQLPLVGTSFESTSGLNTQPVFFTGGN